jgi:RNA polymerase sigma factor (sigma-70 family)
VLPPFQAFLDEHKDAVYRFLVASVGAGEVDDCFQETFIAALRAYATLNESSSLRAWILKIAQRKAIDAHRSRARRPHPHDVVPEDGRISGPPEPEAPVWGAVRALPAKQRSAVVQRYINDLPYKEIGDIIGCSEEAARQNVRAGIKRLREVWS